MTADIDLPWIGLSDTARDEVRPLRERPVPRPPRRLTLIEQAVTSGRHVLAQKPLCAEPAEVDRLLTAVRGSDAGVAVNQNGRFALACRGDISKAMRLLDWSPTTT